MSKGNKNKDFRNNSKGGSKGSKFILTPELGRMATAINMLTPNGLDHNFANGTDLINATDALTREPGVAANVLSIMPAGVSNGPLSPLNEAARAMFTWIRNKLMKNITRYEKSDLMIMCLAVACIMAAVNFFKLSLRVLKKFKVLNKYTPIAILRAMQIDTSDLTRYSIEMEKYLDLYVSRLKQLVVPKLPIFEDIIDTFSHIYMDEDIEKCQYIVNVPAYFLKYELDAEGKGKLVPVRYSKSSFTHSVEEIEALLEDLISNLFNDEDYGFMSGDIMAAYSDVFTMPETLDFSPIEFEYDKDFLEKWHNSCQFGAANSNDRITGWEITQDSTSNLDDILLFDPEITLLTDAQFETWRRGAGNRYIDFYDRSVTPERIMNATRWMFSFDVVDESAKKIRFSTVGNFIIEHTYLFYYDRNNELQSLTYDGVILLSEDLTGYHVVSNMAKLPIILSKWNYYPLTIHIVNTTSVSGHVPGYLGLSGDLGNYTVIDKNVLKQMNTLANYTIIGVNPLVQGK